MSETRDTRFQAADASIAMYSTIIDELIKVAGFASQERAYDSVALLLGNAMQATAMRTQIATALAEENEDQIALSKRSVIKGDDSDDDSDDGNDDGNDDERDPLDVFNDG